MMTSKKAIKYLSVFLSLLFFAFPLSSCSQKENNEGKIRIVGTVFPQFDFAREIGGDRVECEMLMAPGTDSHSYTGDNPSDILKIQKSDIFIYVGGETDEKWVEKALNTIEKSGEKVPVAIALTDCCELTEETSDGIIEKEDEHGHGEEETEYDEHVWTSLRNSEKAVASICDALCELDPEGSEYYRNNSQSYIKKLEELDCEFSGLFENGESNILVFADRFPFRYFAKDYSLTCYAAFNGCASESEPSPTTIVELCNIVKDNSLSAVFYIETSRSNVSNVIEKATGTKAYLLHSCHTVTEKELKEGVSYIGLMKQNLETLKKVYEND